MQSVDSRILGLALVVLVVGYEHIEVMDQDLSQKSRPRLSDYSVDKNKKLCVDELSLFLVRFQHPAKHFRGCIFLFSRAVFVHYAYDVKQAVGGPTGIVVVRLAIIGTEVYFCVSTFPVSRKVNEAFTRLPLTFGCLSWGLLTVEHEQILAGFVQVFEIHHALQLIERHRALLTVGILIGKKRVLEELPVVFGYSVDEVH